MELGLFTPSVRGNLLDLEHIWQDADGPDSSYLPVPSHLSVVWHEGLPYWKGLTEQEKQLQIRTTSSLSRLFSFQEVSLRWLPFQDFGQLYTSVEDAGEQLYPAFTLVAIPARFRMPSPRYNHTHTKTEVSNHPPVKVRWPEPGFTGLSSFLIEAMLMEGIASWKWPMAKGMLVKPTSISIEGSNYLVTFAVATAPWFGASAKMLTEEQIANLSSKELLSAQSPEIKHIGTAIAKLDYYLFSKT